MVLIFIFSKGYNIRIKFINENKIKHLLEAIRSYKVLGKIIVTRKNHCYYKVLMLFNYRWIDFPRFKSENL